MKSTKSHRSWQGLSIDLVEDGADRKWSVHCEHCGASFKDTTEQAAMEFAGSHGHAGVDTV